jgi:hypothetical protein
MIDDTPRKCSWPGCSDEAELHLPGRSQGEWLCAHHAMEVIADAGTANDAEEELNAHRESGGKLS